MDATLKPLFKLVFSETELTSVPSGYLKDGLLRKWTHIVGGIEVDKVV